MKKRINLLSPEAISATGTRIKFPVFRGPLLLKVAASSLVLLAVFSVYLQTSINVYRWHLTQAKKIYANNQAELKQNKNILARLNIERDNLIRNRNKLEDKMVIVSRVTKPQVEVSTLFATLTEMLPDKLWINKVSLEKNRLRLVGKATDNAVISDCMVRLDRSPYFANTSFEYTEKKKSGEQMVTEFVITSVLENTI